MIELCKLSLILAAKNGIQIYRKEVFTLTSEKREDLIDKMTENLPVLRKKLKLSQEDLAQLMGSSRYTVMQLENRKRKMTWNTFLSLMLLFDKNEETSVLLRALAVYTDDFDRMIRQQPEIDFLKTQK